MSAALPQVALDLILHFEGIDQPGKWPGAGSGITLGVGYDLGYVTKQEFMDAWQRHLHPNDMSRLWQVVGIKGVNASKLAHNFTDIRISKDQAREVFHRVTVPKFCTLTSQVFRGVEQLPDYTQGALVSLVFNRGGSTVGDRRTEMRAIQAVGMKHLTGDIETAEAKKTIAGLIRDMVRLWPVSTPTGLGLRRRRLAEAKLALTGEFP